MQDAALRDDTSDMTDPKDPNCNGAQVTVRLPAHLLERIDAHRSRMAEAAPGVGIKRSDAVRSLIVAGLSVVESAT